MPVTNSYIVHAFEIHSTTGVGLLDVLQPEHRLLIATQMFRIDAENERWKPLFDEINTHLRDVKKLNGDLKHQMWDITRFQLENGPLETQYKSEILQISKTVDELCLNLIETTKDALMFKIRSVTSSESLQYQSEMRKIVTTEQVVQYWNLLKYWLKYLWWVNFTGAGVQIPLRLQTILSYVQTQIDECILQEYHVQVPDIHDSIIKEKTLSASRLIPSRIRWHNLDLEEHFVLFTNALNACTEMSLYFHTYPKLKELLFERWKNENKKFVKSKLPEQVKNRYETEIQQFTKYAKQEYIDGSRFCENIYRQINEKNNTVASELKLQPNFIGWHYPIHEISQLESADLEADFELVRHKCIKYAHTLAIDYKIDDQFVKECENFIQEMVRSQIFMSQTKLTQHYITNFIEHAVKFYEAMHNGDCENLSKYWILLTICKSDKHFAPVLQNNQINELANYVVSNISGHSRINFLATTSPDQLLRTLPTVKEVRKHNYNHMLRNTVFWKICNNDMQQ